MKLKNAYSLEEKLWSPRQHVKKQRHYFVDKGLYSQSHGFSSRHVWMWAVDHKEGWTPKNWCFWIVVLETTLESPLDSKEVKPVNPKGNQPWIFIGKTDAEAEASILWSPDADSQLTGKDPDAGKDWRQEERGMTEDEMAGWHHWLNGLEFEQTLGDREGQGSLMCCSPWGSKKSEQLSDWTTLSFKVSYILVLTFHKTYFYRQINMLYGFTGCKFPQGTCHISRNL